MKLDLSRFHIKTIDNDKKNLSTAALETLSIIAYKQPVIKSDIEHIRGVKSDRVLETSEPSFKVRTLSGTLFQYPIVVLMAAINSLSGTPGRFPLT